MGDRGYAYVRYPWKSLVGTITPGPARFLSSLLNFGLTYSAPGGGGAAIVRRALARKPPSPAVLQVALRAAPRRDAPDLDRLALDLFAAWPRLTEGHDLSDPPVIDLLALTRRSALTVFVFTGGDHPRMVVKIPRGDAGGPVREAEALQVANGAGGAPRYLGRCGPGFVQEAVAGDPVPIRPLPSDRARTMPWETRHAELAEALRGLAVATKAAAPPRESHGSRAREGVASAKLSSEAGATASDALTTSERLDASTLKHGDLSPQNCLFRDGRFAGIVDWETAIRNGTPGFDLLNFGVAEFEHRLALYPSSPSVYREAFLAAWSESPFFSSLRAAVRDQVLALDLEPRLVQAIEITFFARRLGHRMADAGRYVHGVDAAAGILEGVIDQRARAT